MTTSVTIAIDPGLDGAIACLGGTELYEVVDMPTRIARTKRKRNNKGVMVNINYREVDPDGIDKVFTAMHRAWSPNGHTSPHVVIEKVWSSPGAGVSSTWTFSGAYHTPIGIACGRGWVLTTVTPTIWKGDLGLSSDKYESLVMARRLWPEHADSFKRVKDADRAEAALLGVYVARGNEVAA